MNDVPAVESDLKVPVRYVGSKELKYDNICHTRTKWSGNGDVQLVPIGVAARLARFPRVWEIVEADKGVDPDLGVYAVGHQIQKLPDAEHEQSGTAALVGLPGPHGRRPVLKLNKKA